MCGSAKPSHRLYEPLEREDPGAHSRYNALVGRISSFARAAPDGNVDLHHFDPYSQALSKIERDFTHDREDVRKLIGRGLVEPVRLRELFDAIEPDLFRYPAIDPSTFRRKVDETLTA